MSCEPFLFDVKGVWIGFGVIIFIFGILFLVDEIREYYKKKSNGLKGIKSFQLNRHSIKKYILMSYFLLCIELGILGFLKHKRNPDDILRVIIVSIWINDGICSIYMAIRLDDIWQNPKYNGKYYCSCIPFTYILCSMILMMVVLVAAFDSNFCLHTRLYGVFSIYSGYNIILLISMLFSKMLKRRLIIYIPIFTIVLILRLILYLLNVKHLILINYISVLFNIIMIILMDNHKYYSIIYCFIGDIDNIDPKKDTSSILDSTIAIPIESRTGSVQLTLTNEIPSKPNKDDKETNFAMIMEQIPLNQTHDGPTITNTYQIKNNNNNKNISDIFIKSDHKTQEYSHKTQEYSHKTQEYSHVTTTNNNNNHNISTQNDKVSSGPDPIGTFWPTKSSTDTSQKIKTAVKKMLEWTDTSENTI